MRRLLEYGFLSAAVLVATGGCVESSRRHVVSTDDVVPPGEPRDVYTVTGDGEVTLYWSPPGDPGVAGYSVFISQDDVDYYRIDDVGPSRRHFVVDGDGIPSNVPFTFVNGTTYWLGVAAFDDAGNESPLSEESTMFDTPRPAGRDLVLYDVHGPRTQESGYDFSRSPYGYPMPGNSLFADIYFVIEAGDAWIRTPHPQVVELQDVGAVGFDDARAGWLDEATWTPTDRVRVREGHVCLVKIYEETRPQNANEPFHVAKFRVVRRGADAVTLDWAYQIAPNNRELKPTVHASAVPGGARREVHR